MKCALMLPLLSISSGHHHVADSIKVELEQDGEYRCIKEELLSNTFGLGERFISNFYLRWIQFSPKSYTAIYKFTAQKPVGKDVRYTLFEAMFLTTLQKIIEKYKPSVIICTHALPSYLLGIMKKRGELSIPVVNVYTDYYINNIWGRQFIDIHFVPDQVFKHSLTKRGVPSSQIYVQGIPTHRTIRSSSFRGHTRKEKYHVLISGGNLGTGDLYRFIRQLNPGGRIHYQVLCGKNKGLYERLTRQRIPAIEPLPYIHSREQMDQLYNESDAIVTKPGGVTVAECLQKRLPIFVYDYLPGQEKYNLDHLSGQKLVNPLLQWDDIEKKLLLLLDNEHVYSTAQSHIENYHNRMDSKSINEGFKQVLQGL
ncbi:MGDG synthase family glycosyltransferase [Pseudalkalibacillus decolorationis]|uniref:MGDG synthase family glycosyltransferase n=1 Tax=Pseudalkalibacillus decolorationis TaxID=163879 RepID=UPI002147F66B|nr:UDP-glucuronosyltransferase [Pseudalkalibacillus decolorationis]